METPVQVNVETQLEAGETQPDLLPLKNDEANETLPAFINEAFILEKYQRKRETLINYQKKWLPFDIAAGLSVGVAAIPLGMSYALMGRFPPEYGLYSQMLYSFIYSIFGTGRQVCVGANGIEALLTADALEAILGWDASSEAWITTGAWFAGLTGIIMLIFYILRFGFIANFLADPVVSGFSTGCACIVALSQTHYFFGIEMPKVNSTVERVGYIIAGIQTSKVPAILIGLGTLLSMWVINEINRKYLTSIFPVPASLVVVVLFTYIAYFFSSQLNLPMIGPIPPGFPKAQVYVSLDSATFFRILKEAFYYAVAYFLLHCAIAKAIASHYNFQIRANQELMALGVCSLLGSAFQCCPPATSLTRTSLAKTSGARTQCYLLINALTVVIILFTLTPYIQYLPMSTLAAIVMYGVVTMMDFHGAFRLLRGLDMDFVSWLLCFLSTIFLGAIYGIFISIGFSLYLLLRQYVQPRMEILGQFSGTGIFRSIQDYALAKELPNCRILCFDGPLNFWNAGYFEAQVMEQALDQCSEEPRCPANATPWTAGHEGDTCAVELCSMSFSDFDASFSQDTSQTLIEPTQFILIDASCIHYIDNAGQRVLGHLKQHLLKHNQELAFFNWKGQCSHKFYKVISASRCFLTIHDALAWIKTVKKV